MHIVYLTEGITSPGGTERVLSVKANYLRKKGYNVSVISQKKIETKPFFDFDNQINIYDLNDENKKIVFIKKLNELLKIIKPDILICLGLGLASHGAETNYPCKKVLEWHFAKYKSRLYFYKLDKYKLGRIFTNLCYSKTRKAIKKFDKFVVLTNEDRLDWGNFNNIITISNPITVEIKKFTDVSHKRVLAIGRLSSQKAFNLLIDIWKDIAIKFPDWELSIYGEGKKKDKLQKKISKNHLENSITLHGNSKDIQSEYSKSSIYAMTSIYEGQPLVLIEAMMSGLPIISYACKCGPRDIIHNEKDGYIIEMFDKSKFVEKLSLLISNENLRISMSQNAKVNSNKYEINTIMKQWINLFDELNSK